MEGKLAETKEDALKFVIRKAYKCLRVVVGGKKQVLVKESKKEPYKLVKASEFERDYGKTSVFYEDSSFDKKGNLIIKHTELTLSEVLKESVFMVREVVCEPYHEGYPDPYAEDDNVLNVFPGYQAKL